jgi:hypothetical protein
MPRKSKVVQAAERKEALEKLDRAVRNAPPHIKARLGSPSRLPPPLEPEPGSYTDWNGLVCTADGELGRHPDHASVNKLREAEALRFALALEEQFSEELWTRNGASSIAKKLSIHPSRVRRARQRLKRAGK